MTALDGTATVRLRPGNYTIESDQPFAFQGRLYTWIETLDVASGREAVLELTADNAEVESGGATPRQVVGRDRIGDAAGEVAG